MLIFQRHNVLDVTQLLVSHKTKPSWFSGPLVFKDGAVLDIPVLDEIVLELFI